MDQQPAADKDHDPLKDLDSNSHNTPNSNLVTSTSTTPPSSASTAVPKKSRARNRRKDGGSVGGAGAAGAEGDDSAKRRCVSTACVACRKRKSKCDGNTPACAACSQVYGTECIYDPNSDHRRKGVYKKDIDGLKTRNSTLQTLVQALLNYPEEDVPALVRQIRTCESLDDIAEQIVARENGVEEEDDDIWDTSPVAEEVTTPTFETQLGTKMGELRLDDGSVRYIGGTSNLLFLSAADAVAAPPNAIDQYQQQEDPITSWTSVTSDPELVVHLINMYFTWHYTYFTCLSKSLFYRDFLLGKPPDETRRKTEYCTPLLVNAILALGCHFTSFPGARENPEDSATAGDHFFKEAKRLIMENDEHERPKMTTVQALALMSVREAGCGREAKGWVYSGMSFRMACDMGLHLDSGALAAGSDRGQDEGEEDARRITFWGCFLFDKCWSNYLGRLPQLSTSMITIPKFDVFPDEDSAPWTPCSDGGFSSAHVQPSRTRAVALQISALCEISNDLMRFFYNPSDMADAGKPRGKQAELKKLSEIHTRLESWRRELPKEMEPREGGLSSVLIMHMFFQLLFIHLFRPFLKYNAATSPLPSTVSPRKLCTQAAAMISKLLRLYKRSHGLRQICNICVYIAHSACTIHLLNLPNKDARRDIIHGVKHLEEIAEGWLCARRTLCVISTIAKQWKVELPEEAATVLARTDAKFGPYQDEVTSPSPKQNQPTSTSARSMVNSTNGFQQPAYWPQQHQQQTQMLPTPISAPTTYFTSAPALASYQPASSRSNHRPSVSQSSYTQHPLPPQSASDLHPAAYPSAQPTPVSSNQRPTTTGHSSSLDGSSRATTNGAGASPSDMFGGVDQLLRESQDWVFRDQAQLASGFENWGIGGLDQDAGGASGWAAGGGVAGAGGGVDAGVGAAASSSAVTAGRTGSLAGLGNAFGGAAGGGFGGGNVSNGQLGNVGMMGAGAMHGLGSSEHYDEEEWYR